jgi:hypothetical protein
MQGGRKRMSDVCDCWDKLVKVSVALGMLERNIGDREWKKAREETIPKLKSFMEELEKCSGIKLVGTRGAIEEIEERFMPRYDWPSALGTAARLPNELTYDVGCRKVKLTR